jgi:antitoxin component YwqK of YwqJK toxin-antitoxin module
VKGKVHGTVKEFYENGNPKRELPFVEDRMHGVEKEYDGEGNLENTAYWYEGDRVSKDVYRQRVAEDKGT